VNEVAVDDQAVRVVTVGRRNESSHKLRYQLYIPSYFASLALQDQACDSRVEPLTR
jgi:hypothetical protein